MFFSTGLSWVCQNTDLAKGTFAAKFQGLVGTPWFFRALQSAAMVGTLATLPAGALIAGIVVGVVAVVVAGAYYYWTST